MRVRNANLVSGAFEHHGKPILLSFCRIPKTLLREVKPTLRVCNQVSLFPGVREKQRHLCPVPVL